MAEKHEPEQWCNRNLGYPGEGAVSLAQRLEAQTWEDAAVAPPHQGAHDG